MLYEDEFFLAVGNKVSKDHGFKTFKTRTELNKFAVNERLEGCYLSDKIYREIIKIDFKK